MATNVDQLCDFIDVFNPFKEELDSKIELGKLEFESIETQLTNVIAEYGEDPKAIAPKDFFQIFYSFAKEFSEAYKKEVQRRSNVIEKQKRQKNAKERKRLKGDPTSPDIKVEEDEVEMPKTEQAEELMNFGKSDKRKAP